MIKKHDCVCKRCWFFFRKEKIPTVCPKCLSDDINYETVVLWEGENKMKDLKQLKTDYEQLGKTIKELEDKNNFDFKVKSKLNCHHKFSKLAKDKYFYIYETGKEEEIWEKKLNALHALRLIANELNGEPQHEWIDWTNRNQRKHYIYFDGVMERWEISYDLRTNHFEIRFRTEVLAEKAIEYMEHYNLLDDLKL